MNYQRLLLFLMLATLTLRGHAADFREDSQITQISGEVSAKIQSGPAQPAQLSEKIVPGDILTTGANSRAELTSSDSTVIRVGAHSIFSFSSESREMILNQGSLLFHVPHGEGGGTIKTAAVTAAVTGSTVALSTTSSGGAKVVPLESPCIVTGSNGRPIAHLVPGQMLALMAGHTPLVLQIDLAAFTRTSGLMNHFAQPLTPAIQNKITSNVNAQSSRIETRPNIVMFDDLAFRENNPISLPQPPAPVHANLGAPGPPMNQVNPPPITLNPPPTQNSSTISFNSNLTQTFGNSLTLDQNFPTNFGSENLNLQNSNDTLSPIAYLENNQTSGAISTSLANYLSSGTISEQTLATLGITSPLNSSFLPSTALGLIGGSVTLTGTTDANVTNLAAFQSAGYYAILASGNMSFVPTAGSNAGLTFTNSPNTLAFGAGGTMTFDGSVCLTFGLGPGLTHAGIITDAANLLFASVGDMNMNQVFLCAGSEVGQGSGNVYAGSLSQINFLNTRISAGLIANLYSGGDINFAVSSIESGCPEYSPGVYAYGSRGGPGNISVEAAGTINLSGTNGQTGYFSLPTTSYNETGGTINLTAGSSVNVSGAFDIFDYSTSGSVNITAGQDISLTELATFSAGNTETLKLTAGGTLAINLATSTNIGNFGSFIFSAPTMNLSNITFPLNSIVVLKSLSGVANFGGIVLHDVNFISAVYYGSSPITNAGQLAALSQYVTVTHQ